MSLCLSNPVQIKNNEPLQEIIEFINNIKSITKRYQSFEQIEQDIKMLMNKLESAVLTESLEQYDIHTKVIINDGKLYRHVLREEKTYFACAGKISVERSLYRGPDGTNICPLELQSGIIESSWTPSAARSAYYVTAQLSPYQGENLFKELGRFTPSKSSLDRLSRKIGRQWDSKHDEFFNSLSNKIIIPEDAVCISASFDGIMLPMKTKKIIKEADDKKGKPEETKKIEDKNKENKKDAETKEEKAKPLYKEAACAAVCFYNDKGERLSTIRFGRMPEAKKKTLKNELSETVEQILTQKNDLTLVKLADGARDNWRYLGDILRPSEGVEVLDFFHASEHLNKAIEAIYKKGSPECISHFKQYRSLLKHDEIGVVKVIRTLRYFHKKFPKRKVILTELNYFKNNRRRMNYAEMAAKNYPIGSGVTEASCKTLVTQRLKCSGMRWDIAGGQGVLTARSLIQSERFEAGWSLLAQSYTGEITLPKNVVLLN
jgi:hypothetical protein